jgi:hypothetical protein
MNKKSMEKMDTYKKSGYKRRLTCRRERLGSIYEKTETMQALL